MIQSFYSAANGLHSQQLNIDVISDNVANVNTTGYKQSRLDFKDALYTRMRNPVDNADYMNLKLGTGVIPMQANRIFQQGVVQTTDRPLDFMLEGRGFFTVQDYDDEGNEVPRYTRDGAFYLTSESMLVDSAGRYILNADGETITVEGDPSKMEVSPEGFLSFTDENGDIIDTEIQLGIVDFINPNGLVVTGDNLFAQSDNSGEPEQMETLKVVSGALEGSNVDLALETTRLIRAQRAYQFAARALSVADQMAGLANTIRQ